MDNFENILKGPDFFTCKRFNSRMLKIRCIERQEENYSLNTESFTTSETGLSFEVCSLCDQGKTIRDEIISEKLRPSRGEGKRKIKCVFYNDECLDHAAKQNWKTFNCGKCPLYKNGLEPIGVMGKKAKVKNTRICETEECNNITLGPGCPLCPSCMAKKAKQTRDAKKKNAGENTVMAESKKDKDDYKPNAEIVDPGEDMAIVIRFEKHLPALKAIEKMAEEELRPIDMQIIYMLKQQLKTTQEAHTEL